MNTRKFEDLGYREINELKNILDAWMTHGLPADFDAQGVVWEFNPNSGSLFLTNDYYQVAILIDGKLESFYYTPYAGHEGILDDLLYDIRYETITELEDIEYILNICEDLQNLEGVSVCEKALENLE